MQGENIPFYLGSKDIKKQEKNKILVDFYFCGIIGTLACNSKERIFK